MNRLLQLKVNKMKSILQLNKETDVMRGSKFELS